MKLITLFLLCKYCLGVAPIWKIGGNDSTVIQEQPSEYLDFEDQLIAESENLIKRQINRECSAYGGERGKTMSRSVFLNGKCLKCGGMKLVDGISKRIIGGAPTTEGEFPWHVAIYDRAYDTPKLVCGGTLVSPDYILTAAHCFHTDCLSKDRPVQGRYTVTIGHRLRTSYRRHLDIQDIICHERYEMDQHKLRPTFDVALLRLQTPTTSPFVCIDSSQNNEGLVDSTGCFGLGHGLTDAGVHSTILRKTSVNFLSNQQCKRMHWGNANTDWLLCTIAADREGNDGASRGVSCEMDSGSPVVCPVRPGDPCSPYMVKGIFSYGNHKKCSQATVSVLTDMGVSRVAASPWYWVWLQIGMEYDGDLGPNGFSACDLF